MRILELPILRSGATRQTIAKSYKLFEGETARLRQYECKGRAQRALWREAPAMSGEQSNLHAELIAMA
jgi:hypothetical protein